MIYKKRNRFLVSYSWLLILGLLTTTFLSCSPKEKQKEQISKPSLNDLYQAWYTQTTLRRENIDYQTTLDLSSQIISLYGEEGINKIFSVLENQQEKPLAKYLAVMALTPYLKEDWATKLLPLTEPDKEVNTRVCAISLLSLIQTPEVTSHLKKYINDPEPRVQFEVLTALAKRGEPEGIQQIQSLWDKAKDSPDKREHILLSIPASEIPSFLPLFRESAKDEQLTLTVRREAIMQLGRYGKEKEDVDTLKSILDTEIENSIKELVQSALDAVNARLQRDSLPQTPSN
ncbi:MAG TPA: HEAT repeat domain-containing protein [Candidatus Hydrogenedens sp.]|nr:HEAT repeat domain-containing protein [Candidatus Hydrogenedens sp.]